MCVIIKINDVDSNIHEGLYDLPYSKNNLRIEYIGLSFLSGGDVRYQYRLLNTSTEWQTTTNTSIELRSLSPGKYIFEVCVLDKFGNRSLDVARVRFDIRPAYYQTIWFWVLIFIFALGIGYYFIRRRFEQRRKMYEREQELNMKIIELEQQALKAQMNPYFIFNCLASIQHFVNKEQPEAANRYLSNFAKLIRKTLDLSGEQYISLDKEVDYLENYVQMEKLRFQDKFSYTITVGENIDEYNIMIPPMLIQPIVENAIRHGLRYKENNDGMLKISFESSEKGLICTVEDNGIGRKRSRELKSALHIEYQSKGTLLTESRINAINMLNDRKISMEANDLLDANQDVAGTIVRITFEQ
jgi:signal transduction histidine kinase